MLSAGLPSTRLVALFFSAELFSLLPTELLALISARLIALLSTELPALLSIELLALLPAKLVALLSVELSLIAATLPSLLSTELSDGCRAVRRPWRILTEPASLAGSKRLRRWNPVRRRYRA